MSLKQILDAMWQWGEAAKRKKEKFQSIKCIFSLHGVTSTSVMETGEVKEKAEKTLGLNDCKSIVQGENVINK